MSTFGKVSLVTFGLLLFWDAFVLGIESLSQGNAGGLLGVGAFLAVLVALTKERFRAYLRTVTKARSYPARVFVAFAVSLVVFLPQAISTATDPLAFVNVHVTRSLITVGVTAGLSAAALLTNAIVYFISGR